MLDRKLFTTSFLPLCCTSVPCRTGNFSPPVSCQYAKLLSHAGQETFHHQFPTGMFHSCPMPDRKLFANSFLSVCSTSVPCRIGNYSQTVSCQYAKLLSHAGQETSHHQFPAAMLHFCPMPNRKLFITSFLPLCCTSVPCRIGNFSSPVSCRYAPPLRHAGQETSHTQGVSP